MILFRYGFSAAGEMYTLSRRHVTKASQWLFRLFVRQLGKVLEGTSATWV